MRLGCGVTSLRRVMAGFCDNVAHALSDFLVVYFAVLLWEVGTVDCVLTGPSAFGGQFLVLSNINSGSTMVFFIFIWRVVYHDSTMDLLYFFLI